MRVAWIFDPPEKRQITFGLESRVRDANVGHPCGELYNMFGIHCTTPCPDMPADGRVVEGVMSIECHEYDVRWKLAARVATAVLWLCSQ